MAKRICNAVLAAAILFAFSCAPRDASRDKTVVFAGELARLPAALEEWNRLDSFPMTDALRALKRGMDAYFSERYAAVLESLEDAQAGKTALGDYLLFYRAKSLWALDRNEEALREFQRLESLYPDSPFIRESLLAQCQLLIAANQPKAALTVLANPKIGTSAEISYYEAKALDMSGEKEKAADRFLRIYSRFPTSQYGPLAERYFTASSPGAFKGARNYGPRLLRAETLIGSGDYRPARLLLVALGKFQAPSPALSEKRNLLFGEVEYRLGKSAAAIPYFRKVSASDPALHAKALYLEGLCLRRLDRYQDLIELRDRVLKLYPRSSEAEELCYSVATHFDVTYDQSNSRQAYALLQESFPKGKYSERALWKLALFPYFENKYAEAVRAFWKYLVAYPAPSSSSSAMYWMGRCYAQLGDTESAKYLFRRTRELVSDGYYGQRAREAEDALGKTHNKGRASIEGIDFNQVVTACDEIQPPPMEFAAPDMSGSRILLRTRQLVAAGFSDLALTELRFGRTQHRQSEDALSYVMARICLGKQEYDAAIASLRRAFPDYNNYPMESLPSEVWEILFPVRHWGVISEQSSKFGMDPNLILGLIRQESAFEEKARSKANARGLMQLLPINGKRLAKQAGIRRYTAQKLYQGETNIILGTRYFASVLQKYGKPELALAAYNAGNSRVDLWLEEFGNIDMAEFVEQIPFAETRGYVKQVMSNKVHYDLLTSSSAAKSR